MPDHDDIATGGGGEYMSVTEYDELRRRFATAMHDCVRGFFLKHGDAKVSLSEIEEWVSASFDDIVELTSYQRDVLQAEVAVCIDRRRRIGPRGRYQNVH